MALKDIFKKTPTKENAKFGAAFDESNTPEEIFNFLQQARNKGENIYIEYVYEVDIHIGQSDRRERIYALDNFTLEDIYRVIKSTRENPYIKSRIELLSHNVASELHEDWRQTRLKEDGTFEPRWKSIKDQNFIKELNPNQLPNNIRTVGNSYEIDIANSTYDQLSPDWQYENQEAGKVAAGLVIGCEYGENLTNEAIGSEIHNEWLKRNTWAKGGELDVPFTKLPKNEQDKDLRQFKIAKSVYEQIKHIKHQLNREDKQQDDDGITM